MTSTSTVAKRVALIAVAAALLLGLFSFPLMMIVVDVLD
jgi:hypothetical protein